ncbi:hypothetical protein FQR65_LT10761 [Abscondita terminalis]|nr:hypothetical protein FQR65_LT10761 [Abscondita terminalis]
MSIKDNPNFFQITRQPIQQTAKTYRLLDLFRAVIDDVSITLGVNDMRNILLVDLNVPETNLRQPLLNVLEEVILHYCKTWKGWEKSIDYYKDQFNFQIGFLEILRFIREKCKIVIEQSHVYIEEVAKSQLEETTLVTDPSKPTCPYKLTIGGPPSILNTLVAVIKNDDILIKQHEETPWRTLTASEFLNWPFVSVEVKLLDLELKRVNTHNFQRYIAKANQKLPLPESKFISEVTKLSKDGKPYTHTFFNFYFIQLFNILRKIQGESRISELQHIYTQFLMDIKEMNIHESMCTNTTVQFNIGKQKYSRSKLMVGTNNENKNGLRAINYVEHIIPQIDLTLHKCTAAQDMSDTKSVTFKRLNTIKVSKVDDDTTFGGYYGFKLYVKFDSSSITEVTLQKINCFEKHFKEFPEKYNLQIISKTKSFNVDLLHIYEDNRFQTEWKSFRMDVLKDTETVLALMAVAMHQLIVKQDKEFNCRVRPYLINHQPILHLKNLKTNCFSSLVSVCGTVIKASNTRQLLTKESLFKCGNCNGTQVLQHIDNVYSVPKFCPTKGCRAQSKFVCTLDSPQTRTVNWQSLKIQELIGVGQYENGRVPRTIDCEVTEDLVGFCVPGDDVTITGIIKSHNCARKNQPSVFSMYIDVISIINNKNKRNGSIESITFNEDDCKIIQKIHSEPSLFRYLVQSLCPTIYGNEIVKAGLLLSLLGGTHYEDEMTRSISHVLMVGDPGLGKSQMLLACANVAPRGVYVCGNTSTNSGLTVTMTKESNGDYSLEAGALILADQGCCCIDEFDKMAQHNTLLEAMEQQSVSIAKAGVMCNLSARASILAAGNPIGGHYNKAKTVAENLKISSPLISRFDLVFVLVDRPCQKYDKLVSERVLGLHRNNKQRDLKNHTGTVTDCLEERLRFHGDEGSELLDHQVLRKYIAYAQKYVHPVINSEAQDILKNFYLELRRYCQIHNCSPITPRQLESMIRLTQARAKAELREEATVEDAVDVLEIMRSSFIDIFTDETGTLDFRRSQSGSGMSKQKQLTAFLSYLQKQAEELSQSVFSRDELRAIAEENGITRDRFSDLFQKLNFHGYLLKRAANKFQLASADF